MKNLSEANSERAKAKRNKVIAVIVIVLAVVTVYYATRGPKEDNGAGVISKQYDKTSDLNAQNEEGKIKFTVDQLSKAVLENDTELVNSIISDKSVDINRKDSENKYPLEMVLVMSNCDMAKVLLNAGADPYVITSDGESVYDIVMKGDNSYLKEIFEEYKR
mgnify:FL=1